MDKPEWRIWERKFESTDLQKILELQKKSLIEISVAEYISGETNIRRDRFLSNNE